MQSQANVNPDEINKFGAKANRWWDPNGELKTLHQINPLRLDYISRHMEIANKKVVDIGCGGGILSEGLAQAGAQVTAIDMSADLIDIADLHSLESELSINYQTISAEQLADEQPEQFDCVTCMEMLEHVPDPESVIRACAALVKPGGLLFFSTLNRNRKAWLLAIVAAEYVMRMLPRGTHDYKHFIQPSELATMARHANLRLKDMGGITYNPVIDTFSLGNDIDVNYLAVFEKIKE